MKSIVVLCLSAFLLAAGTEKDTKDLDAFVDAWHLAATKADGKAYFDMMHEDFVFLGTAPGERWTKTAFHEFAMPYFEKGRAWDFKASARTWSFSPKGDVAWFDETLDTWMKDCRGSGVMVKIKGTWKLSYYNLTVLIENEKIKPFIALRESDYKETER